MLHLSQAQARAYLDGEISTAEIEPVEAHLGSCAACRELLQQQDQRMVWVQERLTRLDTGLPERSTRLARARLAARLNQVQEKQTMKSPLFSRSSRPVWIGLALVAVLVASLAIPSVQALATSFLGLFRVQQITVIPFNPNDLPLAEGDSKAVMQLIGENATYDVDGETQVVADAGQASELARIPVRLPAGSQPQEIVVLPGTQGEVALNVDAVNTVLQGLERPLLDASLNGAPISVMVPPAVVSTFGTCPKMPEGEEDALPTHNLPETAFNDCLLLLQMASPEVNTPPELPLQDLGETFLLMTGMPAEEARPLSRQIDWANTLVVPIPLGETTYRSEEVDGALATIVEEAEANETPRFVVMWVKDSILYAVMGSGDTSRGLELVGSLR